MRALIELARTRTIAQQVRNAVGSAAGTRLPAAKGEHAGCGGGRGGERLVERRPLHEIPDYAESFFGRGGHGISGDDARRILLRERDRVALTLHYKVFRFL